MSNKASFFEIPLVVVTGVSAMVLSRTHGTGLQPYGADSAQYIEHLTRMETLEFWRDPGLSTLQFLALADGAFPPLLHLLTLMLGPLIGSSAQEVLWTGLLWLLLLAISVAVVVSSVAASRQAGVAAFCGVMLIPALHGAACRYYYDLPMTALLWAATAVACFGLTRRPLRYGVLAGLFLFAANLVKWTALPFGLIMIAAVSLGQLVEGSSHQSRGWRNSLLGALVAVSVMSCGSLLFIKAMGPNDSFTAMLGEIGTTAAHGGPAGVDSASAQGVLAGVFARFEAPTAARLAFYPSRLLASIYSPLLLAPVLLLLGVWWRSGRRGWTLVAAVLLGQWLFLLVRVPPLDDRFLLTAAPALVIPAAIGWVSLQARLRMVTAALVLVAGFAVGLDFHFRDSPALRSVAPTLDRPERLGEILRWGLADSVDQRGWARRSSQADDRAPLREALWAQLRHCRAQHFRLAADDPLVGDAGDVYWLRYRTLYAHLKEGEVKRTVPPICNEVPAGDTQLALSGYPRGAKPVRPRCIAAEQGWGLERSIELPGLKRGVAVWSLNGGQVCAALATELDAAESSLDSPQQ